MKWNLKNPDVPKINYFRNKWKFITTLLIVLTILLPSTLSKEQSITENNIRITSDKTTYYCSNVFSSDGGCLIQGIITIENLDNKNHNIALGLDATTEIRMKTHKDTTKTKQKNFKTNKKTNIMKNEILQIPFEFYAYDDGKFDYYVKGGLFKTILDPFYNTTQQSNPSFWLESLVVNEDDDDTAIKTNITTELSDNDDATSYETFFNTIFKEQDQIAFDNFETGDLIGGNGFTDVWRHTGTCDIKTNQNPYGTYHLQGKNLCDINRTFDSTGHSEAAITFSAKSKSLENGEFCRWYYYDGTIYNQIYMEQDGDDNNIYTNHSFNVSSYGFSTNAAIRMYADTNQNGDYCYMDNVNITFWDFTGSIADGKAIKTNFNIELNKSLNYWLRVKKITPGLSNITVYNYIDDVNINTTASSNHIITTGWDTIPLNSIINDNMGFRFYTQEYNNFSEVQLIEELEDNIPPEIQDYTINDTELICNDWIRLEANVTDNIDDVIFIWNDPLSQSSLANKIIETDIYFIDIQYTGEDIDTYSFTGVNTTDIINQFSNEIFDLQYTYTCDINDPITSLVSPIDDLNTNETSIDFNCSATDNLGLSNMTLYHNLSGFLSAVQTNALSGTSDHSVFNDNFMLNQSYRWNCEACDTDNNCDFGIQREFFIAQSFPPEPKHIELIYPPNNSIVTDDLITFTFMINHSHSVGLYIDGILNQTIITQDGLNEFSPVRFDQNRTLISWMVMDTNETSNLFFFSTNITSTSLSIDVLKIDECRTETGYVMLIWLIIFISIAFVVIGLAYNIGAFGFFGAILLVISSWYLAPCIKLFAFVIGLISVLLMAFFMIRALGFRSDKTL